MTNQEKIRERIRAFRCVVCREFDFCDGHDCDDDLGELLRELALKGVVIQVDRELPHAHYDIKTERLQGYGYDDCLGKMLRAGYVAVEPLIKDED